MAVTDADADADPRQAPLVPIDRILAGVPSLGALCPSACADFDPRSSYAEALLDDPERPVAPPLGAECGRLRAMYCLTGAGSGRRRIDVRLAGDDGSERFGAGWLTFHSDAEPELRVELLDAVEAERKRYLDGGEGEPLDAHLQLFTNAANGWCARVAATTPETACDAALAASDARCEAGTRRTVTLPAARFEGYAEEPGRVCVRLSDRAGRTVTRTVDFVRVLGRPELEVTPGGEYGWRARACNVPVVEDEACTLPDPRSTDGFIIASVTDQTGFGEGSPVSWLRVEVATPGFSVQGAAVSAFDVAYAPVRSDDKLSMQVPIDLSGVDGPREVRIRAIDRLGRATIVGPVEDRGDLRPIVFTLDTRAPRLTDVRLLDCAACRRGEGQGREVRGCRDDACGACVDEGFFRADGRALLPPRALDLALRTEQALGPAEQPDTVCGVLRGDEAVEGELCPDGATPLRLGAVQADGGGEIIEQQIGLEVFDMACLPGRGAMVAFGRDVAAPTIQRDDGEAGDADDFDVDIECLEFQNACEPGAEVTTPMFRPSRDACAVDTAGPPLLASLSLRLHDLGNRLLDVPVRYRVLAVEDGLDPRGADWSGDGDVPLCAGEDVGRRPRCPAADLRCGCAPVGAPIVVAPDQLEIWRRGARLDARARGERGQNPCEQQTAPVDVQLWLAVEDAVGNRALHALDAGRSYRVFATDPGDSTHRQLYRRLHCPGGELYSGPAGLLDFCEIREGRLR